MKMRTQGGNVFCFEIEIGIAIGIEMFFPFGTRQRESRCAMFGYNLCAFFLILQKDLLDRTYFFG